jgi:predicted nucleic acid-binding Zn ribbon protein
LKKKSIHNYERMKTMKKLIAFFLVVSMLLTTLCMPASAAPGVLQKEECPVCGRNHVLQNGWQDCPEACNLQSEDSIH